MTTDQLREEFENWIRECEGPFSLDRYADGTYCSAMLRYQWRAWQEAMRRCAVALEISRLIKKLRANEQIMVVCDSVTYHADSLLDCLRQADEAKKGAAP